MRLRKKTFVLVSLAVVGTIIFVVISNDLVNVTRDSMRFVDGTIVPDYSQQSQNATYTSHPGYSTFSNGIAILPNVTDTNKGYGGNYHKMCPEKPSSLVGKTYIDSSIDLKQFAAKHPEIQLGGWWKPRDCTARSRVAFVIPYRNRWETLKILLPQLHLVLQRQKIHYRIFLAEQNGTETFNKGRVMNAGFLEAQKIFDFDCLTFHDADLIPEDDRNLYACPSMPRHMSASVSTFNYTGFYSLLIGGVLMMNKSHFRDVNGFSNEYWGWGGEDDDMSFRIENSGYHFIRPPPEIARYLMIEHKKAYRNPQRFSRLGLAKKRQHIDGLNNVQYKLLKMVFEPLYTHLIFDIGKQGKPVVYRGKPCYPWETCKLAT